MGSPPYVLHCPPPEAAEGRNHRGRRNPRPPPAAHRARNRIHRRGAAGGRELAFPHSSNRPRLLQAGIDAFHQPDVRRKILFTLAMLLVFRFFAHIPVPSATTERFRSAPPEKTFINPRMAFFRSVCLKRSGSTPGTRDVREEAEHQQHREGEQDLAPDFRLLERVDARLQQARSVRGLGERELTAPLLRLPRRWMRLRTRWAAGAISSRLPPALVIAGLRPPRGAERHRQRVGSEPTRAPCTAGRVFDGPERRQRPRPRRARGEMTCQVAQVHGLEPIRSGCGTRACGPAAARAAFWPPSKWIRTLPPARAF